MASRITSAASTADEYYYNQTVTPTDAATHTGQLERDADEYFPLQPIEKKLCAYCLGLGRGLMALFIVIFEVFG